MIYCGLHKAAMQFNYSWGSDIQRAVAIVMQLLMSVPCVFISSDPSTPTSLKTLNSQLLR